MTVLKAFFDESFVIPDPVVPSEDGLTLRPWQGEPLTVGGELNKLAFNMAFGRDIAGVQFRRDVIMGISLGFETAKSILAGHATTYHEAFDGFTVTAFDGTATPIYPPARRRPDPRPTHPARRRPGPRPTRLRGADRPSTVDVGGGQMVAAACSSTDAPSAVPS